MSNLHILSYLVAINTAHFDIQEYLRQCLGPLEWRSLLVQLKVWLSCMKQNGLSSIGISKHRISYWIRLVCIICKKAEILKIRRLFILQVPTYLEKTLYWTLMRLILQNSGIFTRIMTSVVPERNNCLLQIVGISSIFMPIALLLFDMWNFISPSGLQCKTFGFWTCKGWTYGRPDPCFNAGHGHIRLCGSRIRDDRYRRMSLYLYLLQPNLFSFLICLNLALPNCLISQWD